jgi:hypothetical protein
MLKCSEEYNATSFDRARYCSLYMKAITPTASTHNFDLHESCRLNGYNCLCLFLHRTARGIDPQAKIRVRYAHRPVLAYTTAAWIAPGGSRATQERYGCTLGLLIRSLHGKVAPIRVPCPGHLPGTSATTSCSMKAMSQNSAGGCEVS